MATSLGFWGLSLVLAPLMLGIIQRTKAFFAGRHGPPFLQPYFDLIKLLQKGAVYSKTTTPLFRAGPIVGLAALLIASLLVPMGGAKALLSFPGDLILFVYLLGLARIATVSAALDTGSSFEGMGASREVWISTLAEPALLLALASLVQISGESSLSPILRSGLGGGEGVAAVTFLVACAVSVILLAENARIPVDDPATHLELTMIHEVMVLDHGGVDFAWILYGSALKLWILGTILVRLLLPVSSSSSWTTGLLSLVGMGILAIAIGVVESSMARLRMKNIPQFLVGAMTLAAIAFLLAVGSDLCVG